MADSSQHLLTGVRKPSVRTIAAGDLIPHIRELADSLQSAHPDQLLTEVRQIRQELGRGEPLSSPHMLVAGLALACEALRRSRSIRLYDVQLLGAIAMSRRCIAQMQTGEGKTYVAATAAIHLALAGRGVHVITPNVYLAERDQQLAASIASVLQLSVALLPERTDAADKVPAYDADITYGTGHEFGFDYLRDQVTLRQQSQSRLGERLLKQLDPEFGMHRATMQRGLACAIVDEADSVLIDDAGSPLVLSIGGSDEAPDADAHRAARALSEFLVSGEHFLLEAATGRIVLTDVGVQRCYSSDVYIPVTHLIRPWTDYVQQALRARWLFRRNIHFVVRDGEVRIVDETTGRIFEDRSWQDGLHQAIEASENLKITAEKSALAQVTRQRFFRLYQHLCGMTGTASGCETELREVYELSVEQIPLRVPSRRVVYSPRFFTNHAAKIRAIAHDAGMIHQFGRAALIGTRSISDSDAVSEQLRQRKIPHQVLNGLQDQREADIVSRAGQPGCITIATNLAGRGTDITIHPEVLERGGLHVIVAECQSCGRMDRQLIGRCARQGDPGSAQIFVAADDSLITNHGPWLSTAMHREADEQGEIHADFSPQLLRIQKSAERQHAASRIALLHRDTQRDSLLRSLQ